MHDPFGDFDLLFAASYSGAKILNIIISEFENMEPQFSDLRWI